MKITDYKCIACEREFTRIVFGDVPICDNGLCCKCCKKQRLQPIECEMAQLEMKRFAEGKQLNENDIKGLLLEKAVSDTLHSLSIPHNHNPFDNTYPCYQNKRPDITIPKIDVVIECKNLSKKQVDHTVSEQWLDENIIKRRYPLKYKHKIVLFSFKPRKPLKEYLNRHGWKTYGLGEQILSLKQERKTIGKIKRRLYWLKKGYERIQKPIPKEQTRLNYVQEAIH